MNDAMRIRRVEAVEILDSRGHPTVEVSLSLGAVRGQASVPSGKSTGRYEALERRDGDPSRYGGLGVLTAVGAVNDHIATALLGQEFASQQDLDQRLIQLDGTPLKSRLGANAILGVSIAAARARALACQQPLYESLAAEQANVLPVPCLNVINGGAHAPNELDFQEFMLVPAGFARYSDALRAGVETYHALARILEADGLSTAVGDEGGFAPAVRHPVQALDLLMRAIEATAYSPGEQMFIALDPAANGFIRSGQYVVGEEALGAAELVQLYEQWVQRYPIVSIEDGLAESDDEGWRHLTRRLGEQIQIVGDDIFVSQQGRVRAAAAAGIANAVLLKPNQVGTLSEIADTARVARAAGYRLMMSHRSGETNDSFIADFAVALSTGQIKAGAPARGERVAKYNQLLRIERELGDHAQFLGRAAFRPDAAKRRKVAAEN